MGKKYFSYFLIFSMLLSCKEAEADNKQTGCAAIEGKTSAATITWGIIGIGLLIGIGIAVAVSIAKK